MEIIKYKPEFRKDFELLNLEWLNKYFWVEPHDEEVLGNPEKYILDPGGMIFFVLENERVIGTVALMKLEEEEYELTKMAILPAYQGQKIGQGLLQHILEYSQSQGWKKLIIYSNRKLENAVFIYKKFGFTEIPIELNNPYSRGEIKLELPLS